ncbi:nucleoside hydrolase [Roseomonas elaeocarpi]|uniref:Nucleoside hydrolase n=1 Tax=Roseomonas elaeocarpi TaxID=907779 RepID=A0ABV6JVQ4_9PROT
MSDARRTVVIDCDPGTDDAVALWLAMASPEIDLRLVTVAGGNVGLDLTLANARAVTGLAGRPVPVVGGARRPILGEYRSETNVHAVNGIGGITLPEGPPAAPGIAADAIRALLRDAAPGEVTLIGLGPATNLALALAPEPELFSRVREIVLMTGAWGEGNWTPSAEFNAASDPEALAMVLATGLPVSLVTLDLTAQALVTPEVIANLREAGSSRCLATACDVLAAIPRSKRFNGRGTPLHDPCAVALVLWPELFTCREVSVTVECGEGPGRGRTHVDRWNRTGRQPHVTLAETLDAPTFFSRLGARLATLP